jgi:hypothetical protein
MMFAKLIVYIGIKPDVDRCIDAVLSCLLGSPKIVERAW